MAESNPINFRPKPPSLLRGIIFLIGKVLFLSIGAWLILLLWFLTEFILINPASAINHVQHIIDLNTQFIGHDILGIGDITHYGFDLPGELFGLLVGITDIVIARLTIFLLAMPLFALFLLIFMTDGLVEREIRKFKGARESTLTFHRAKLCVGFSFFAPLFIFLSLPFYISPAEFLITQSLMLSISAWFAMKYFKKYV